MSSEITVINKFGKPMRLISHADFYKQLGDLLPKITSKELEEGIVEELAQGKAWRYTLTLDAIAKKLPWYALKKRYLIFKARRALKQMNKVALSQVNFYLDGSGVGQTKAPGDWK